ncbi:MAG: PilN domain-containing protein [Parcubacteria group bacterium]|jgi:hypothetical protein
MKIGINLLPQDKKDEILKNERFRSVLGWEIVFFCTGLVFFTFIFGIDYLLRFDLQANSEIMGNNLNGAQYQTIAYYENKFSEINAKLTKISAISSGQLYWSNFFLMLNRATPHSIEIIGLSTKDFSVHLMGKAKTRDDLLSFRDNLSKEECFENVNLPLSDLVSKEDIAFQIDLGIKENCIKKR